MKLIEVKMAAFAYKKKVFYDVNLFLEHGEVCCLMGPNGCGKTTLIDCILGILPLKAGEILIDGQNIQNFKPELLAQKLAYVPQVHNRSFPYTVRQIVLMGRTAHTETFLGPNRESESYVDEVLKNVGIFNLRNRPYTQISGGEMQLVMLARALAQNTPTIIMDEPTAHLDFKNELVFLQTIVKLVKKKNASVLLATHSPNQPFYFESKGLNVKVAAMRDGEICYIGRPSEILTEKNIEEIYSIKSKRLSYSDEKIGNLYQIVPVQTADKQAESESN